MQTIRLTRGMRSRAVLGALVVTALAGATLVAPPLVGRAWAAFANGWPIYQAGNNEGMVNVYGADNSRLGRFPTFMNGGDQLTAGDVDGDGVEEIIVMGDATGGVTVFQDDGTGRDPWGAHADGGDRLAAGDTDGDGVDEIIIVGDGDGRVERYDEFGELLGTFDTNFDGNDFLAAGDLDGDGRDEIIMLGDGNGDVQMFRGGGEPFDDTFDSGFNTDDNFAVGDINGDGRAEILVAGDLSGRVDVFDHDANPLPAIDTSYNEDDGFAAGDVNGDGTDDILVAGNNSGDIDIYNGANHQFATVEDTGFDDGDFLVVGGSPDVDADGIPNIVERTGIKAADGTIVLHPADFGASPCRPTIFVKNDHMAFATGPNHFHNPTDLVLQRVRDAFAAVNRVPVRRCPFPGSSALPGVLLVTLKGDEIPHRNIFSTSEDDVYLDLGDIRDGTNLNGQNPNGVPHLKLELRPYVHYALWAHKLIPGADNPSGITPGFGKDFVIGLEYNTGNLGSTEGKAATFMHELGHSLGLHHGGDEDINFKPNYVSVMNYAFPVGIMPGNRLDYTFGGHQTLNQQHLDERVGIKDGSVQVAWYNAGGKLLYGPGNGPVDWNDNKSVGEPDVEADVDGDLGGICVSDGGDGSLDTTAATSDARGRPVALGVNGSDVIHAGPDYVCQTTAALDADGDPLDAQEQPVGTDLHELRDHDDWNSLDFRRPRVDKASENPAELSVAQLESIAVGSEQAAYPDQALSFGPPPAGMVTQASWAAVDGSRVYVTHAFQKTDDPHGGPAGELVVLDRNRLQELKRVPLGHEPRDIAVNPVSRKLYVVNYGPLSYSVSVINATTLEPITTIPIGQVPVDIAVNTKLNRVYVTNPYRERVEVIDGRTDTLLAPVTVGKGPAGLAVDEATGTVYIGLMYHGSTPFVNALGRIVDTGTTTTVLPPVPVPGGVTQPRAVAVDGSRVYVGNLGGGSVAPSVMAFDKATMALVATIPTYGVWSLGVDRSSGLAFAGTDRGIYVIDTTTLAVTRTMDAGGPPVNVAVGDGLGRQLFAGNKEGQLIRRAYSSGTPAA